MKEDAPIDAIQQLRALPLFRETHDGALEALVAVGRWEAFSAGETIVRQGDPADDMMIVVGGTCVVTLGSGRDEVRLGVVGPGEVLGELTLFRRSSQRSASVVALTTCEVLHLGSTDLGVLDEAAGPVVRTVEREVLRTLACRIEGSRTLIDEVRRRHERPRNVFARLRQIVGG